MQSTAIVCRLLEAEYTAKADDALAVADTAKAFADARGHDIELLQERVEVGRHSF